MAGVTGIYGKHPAFGDFVTTGLPEDAQDVLERWLHKVLPVLRDMWDTNWQAVFDAAPVISFWFGPALTQGTGPLCGVMGPSRDTVGRRFPLVAAVSGSGQLPPSVDPDQSLYAGLLQIVGRFVRAEGTGAAEFGAMLSAEAAGLLTPGQDSYDPGFWAIRPDGDLHRLWADVAQADHIRGAHNRAYMWCGQGSRAAVHVSEGLPTASELAWILTSALPLSTTLAPETQIPETEGTA